MAHVQEWFSDPVHRAAGTVAFDKRRQRFDEDGVRRLLDFAEVDVGHKAADRLYGDQTLEIPGGLTWLVGRPREVPAPVTITAPQLLPFEQLTPENFERLILELARRISHVEHVMLYGVGGQAQSGIDVYCRLAAPPPSGQRYIAIQCRNVTSVSPAQLKALVADFLDGPWARDSGTFVLATRASLRRTEHVHAIELAASTLRDRAGIRFEVWDGEYLSTRLRREPILVEIFFGGPTAGLFCLDTRYAQP